MSQYSHLANKPYAICSVPQISEGIALERESLVKQLEMLREMNKKLRDERDESDLGRSMLGERIYMSGERYATWWSSSFAA